MVSGIKVKSKMQISDGIVLLPQSPSSVQLPSELTTNKYFFNAQLFISSTVISIDCSVSPAFSRPPPDDLLISRQFQHKVKNRGIADFQLQNFYQILSLVCNSSVRPVIRWFDVGEDEIYSGHYSWGCSKYEHNSNQFPVVLTESQVEDSKRLYSQFVNLNSNVRKVLGVAIPRWIKNKKSKTC